MPIKSCTKCGADADTDGAVCQKCGGQLRSKTTVRVIGGIMILLGGFLIAAMSSLAIWVLGMIENSNKPGIGARFNGNRSDPLFIAGVIALVGFIGLASTIAGLWQMVFGRRNRVLVWIIFGLGIIFMIVGLGVAVQR